ncbi:MAG TPA: GNAT family N-acetyltransferase [Bryobacteraceae bacterium]|nr:GNAT family N-acetyltransferase [Bryobacteraceae bacterium]
METQVLVVKEDLRSPIAQDLIESLNTELVRRYPEPGANHFELETDEVHDGHGAFLVAYVDSGPAGCGALRTIDAGVGEIKRMYVRPAERGRGVGRALLTAIEMEARSLGLRRLVLETGIRQPEAIALYRRAGFAPIDAFGEYVDSPLSVCLAKDL